MILKTIVSSSLEKSHVELIFHPAIKNLFNYLFQLVSSAIMKKYEDHFILSPKLITVPKAVYMGSALLLIAIAAGLRWKR